MNRNSVVLKNIKNNQAYRDMGHCINNQAWQKNYKEKVEIRE